MMSSNEALKSFAAAARQALAGRTVDGPDDGLALLLAGPAQEDRRAVAQEVARDLGIDLLTIDLSGLVGKYVGETEQNLDRILAEADPGSLLLLDEADALFGKRSEIRDAHDRYANIDIACLVQRLQSRSGPVILATNSRDAIDEAFIRRIRNVLELPPVGAGGIGSASSADAIIGKQRAIVVNAVDPMQIGRIQIQLEGTQSAQWAMPCFPAIGVFALPPNGSSVWVEFERGDPDFPIWSGCFYRSADEVPAAARNAPPGLAHFIVQTPLGCAISVQDSPHGTGALRIEAGGASLTIDDAGIHVDNGRGARIALSGPAVDINHGALTIT